MTPRSPEVLYENALATRRHRLAWQVVTNRVASSTVFTHGYPGKFAGIIDEQTEELTMREALRDIAAWHAPKASCLVPLCWLEGAPQRAFFLYMKL